MDDDRTTIEAEFQDNEITVYSRDPLMGVLELVSDADETIEVKLDRRGAEALLSGLVQFLARGEGEDAANITVPYFQ